MDEPVFRYIDPTTLLTADAALQEVDRLLAHLQLVAGRLTPDDLADGETLEWFGQRVDWIKRYFERAETLVTTSE